jgi:mannan endo-1,4-beta-mannosidase
MKRFFVVFAILLFSFTALGQAGFVSVKGRQFHIAGKPYYFIGTNYWYGSLLGLEKDPKRGILRLRKELDFLKANGVTNLRLMAGAEGAGLINGVERVGPPLQPVMGKFNTRVLRGLDIILAEMGKRNMKAVIFFSNNWEWSGGFQQYLDWGGKVPVDKKTRKLTWDELRDQTSKFYSCSVCKTAYKEQVAVVMNRRNSVTKKRYIDDPAIMAWELANEPRPMRPAANEDYVKWIADTAAYIKSKDPNHLVTLGHEGSIGTESMEIFEAIHADKNVDYLTIHIWPKNWGWFTKGKLAAGFETATQKTIDYIDEHLALAKKLNKPLVVEEFGLPRDGESLLITADTSLRDRYFAMIFAQLAENSKSGGALAGANFWAFGGAARPVNGQTFWKKGDEYMGDPPMEEQGLNSVFDSDASAWKVIRSYSSQL